MGNRATCIQWVQNNGGGIIRHIFRLGDSVNVAVEDWSYRPFASNFDRPTQSDSLFDQRVEHGVFETEDEARLMASKVSGF